MSLITTIDSYSIPDADILSYPKSTESIAFESTKIYPNEIDLVLDNTDKAKYDDRYSGSLFYSLDFYGKILEIYDDEIGRYIFKGKLKDVKIDDKSDKITIKATNYLDDLSSRTCIYSNSSDKTPAEIIYEIMTDSSNGNIDSSNFVYSGFQNAIDIQSAASAYVNVSFEAEKQKTCMAVINELLRITQCHIYTYQNLIYMYQWQEWGGMLGNPIYKKNVIEGTYTHFYSQEHIYNYYRICYDNAGTIAYSTGSDTGSISTFGERRFNVPNQDIDKTATTDFAISFRNATGAAWAGNLAISRYKNLMKMATLTLGDEMEYISLGEQIDLHYPPFYGEPLQVIERNFDKDKNQIKTKLLFLNTPQQYYSRDSEPPSAVELKSVFALSTGGVFLKWSKNLDTDFAGYRIYFTSSKGAWDVEYCNFGLSPIDNKNTALTSDGYIYQEISQLNEGTQYWFYVTAYDTSLNESEPSNILSVRPLATTASNNYCLQGDMYSGLTLDIDNALAGTVPSDKTTYDNFDDASPDFAKVITAIYESGIQYSSGGFSSMTWEAIGNVYFSYRTSTDGVTYGTWSTEIDAAATSGQDLTGIIYFQFRFIFYSDEWSDIDYVIVTDIEEA